MKSLDLEKIEIQETDQSQLNESQKYSGSDSDENTTNEYQDQINKKLKVYYPIFTIISSLLVVGITILTSSQELTSFYNLPTFFGEFESKISLFGVVALIALLELKYFSNRSQKLISQFDSMQSLLNRVWQSKKLQQQKANTFSGHTDKLKMFISDKLLEYIEYDEKFLHFKGIASEVRHNGVISYDKVITALEKAIEQQHFLSIYEQNNNSSDDEESESNTDEHGFSDHTLDATAKYQNAIDAMRYLWSLLDLSTADNMALHIGNLLIECEEHYCQLELDSEKELDMTQSIPVSPTFYPQVAGLMTMSFFSEDANIRNTLSLAKINQQILNDTFELEDKVFRVKFEPTPELLGNPNHIILLIENLIKNAQFFSQKAKPKQKTNRIVVSLLSKEDWIEFKVYNHGPLIEEPIDNIFKLGYSTRRTKKHHGKGLGLFFTQQIVQGYQGKIDVENIQNLDEELIFNIHLASGESKQVNLSINRTDKQLSVISNDNQSSDTYEFNTDIPIHQITVNSKKDGSVLLSHDVDESSESQIHYNDESMAGRWIISISKFKKQHKLLLKPLDIQGVLFTVKLPTAKSRLDDIEPDFD